MKSAHRMVRSALFACALSFMMCTTTQKALAVDVEKAQREWCKQMAQQGFICIFPPQEDRSVGDVLILGGFKGARSPRGVAANNLSPVIRGFQKIMFGFSVNSNDPLMRVTNLGHLDAETLLQDRAKARPNFNRIPFGEQNGIIDKAQGAKNLEIDLQQRVQTTINHNKIMQQIRLANQKADDASTTTPIGSATTTSSSVLSNSTAAAPATLDNITRLAKLTNTHRPILGGTQILADSITAYNALPAINVQLAIFSNLLATTGIDPALTANVKLSATNLAKALTTLDAQTNALEQSLLMKPSIGYSQAAQTAWEAAFVEVQGLADKNATASKSKDTLAVKQKAIQDAQDALDKLPATSDKAAAQAKVEAAKKEAEASKATADTDAQKVSAAQINAVKQEGIALAVDEVLLANLHRNPVNSDPLKKTLVKFIADIELLKAAYPTGIYPTAQENQLKNIEDGISSRLQNIETLQSKQNSLERSLSQMTKHIESKAVFRPLTAEEKTVPYQLSTVAFPTLISARLTGGDMSAFIPGGTASGFLGLGGSAFKSVTISIPQAYTAFLDEAVIKDLVGIKMDHNVHQKLDLTLNHAANADDSCLENILNNSLLVRKLSRNEKTFWIVIRRAAYYTTEIDVKLERNASTVASGQLNLDIAGSQALFNKGLEQLKLTDAVKTPGGQFTVYHSGSDFIGMSRQFEMPIAIGSNFLMLKLKKVGDTYNVLDVVDY